MRVRIDWRKSVWENAARYYEEAKRLKKKAEGARRAAEETRKKISALEKKATEPVAEEKIRVKEPRAREWFEKFRWFRTSGGKLVLAGKDAKQNELLVARYLEANDLFLHADVHGAPATILKDGVAASEQELREAAQFAAGYSSAWKSGAGACDVYAARREQVAKYSHGEFVPRGGFVIRGQRTWFKHTELKLAITEESGRVIVLPACSPKAAGGVLVVPGDEEKLLAAERIISKLGLNKVEEVVQEVIQLLPGKTRIL